MVLAISRFNQCAHCYSSCRFQTNILHKLSLSRTCCFRILCFTLSIIWYHNIIVFCLSWNTLIYFQLIKDSQLFIIIGILVTFVLAILVTWEIVSPHEMVIGYHVNKVNVCVVYLHLILALYLTGKKYQRTDINIEMKDACTEQLS